MRVSGSQPGVLSPRAAQRRRDGAGPTRSGAGGRGGGRAQTRRKAGWAPAAAMINVVIHGRPSAQEREARRGQETQKPPLETSRGNRSCRRLGLVPLAALRASRAQALENHHPRSTLETPLPARGRRASWEEAGHLRSWPGGRRELRAGAQTALRPRARRAARRGMRGGVDSLCQRGRAPRHGQRHHRVTWGTQLVQRRH